MRMLARLLLVLGLAAAASCRAEAPPAKAAAPFDYWILALSWSPEYCASSSSNGDTQCERAYQFVVHGLWPQYEIGFPRDCGRTKAVPGRLVERMLPLMPSERLIEHEWRKHGACSGLDVQEYFLQTERARRRIVIPDAYAAPDKPIVSNVAEIERRFMQANPGLQSDGIALSCKSRWLSEVRICLDQDFGFRACGRDVGDRCRGEVSIRPSRPGRR
ncbi:ribonuclease T(2) [Solimonas sp. K1W22B-7]|nr:ribonuclease T(2) [Solimonas sp. K1W22B-7]